MSDPKKWRVTLNRWDIYVVHDIEAATEEEAEEIAEEWFDFDFNVDHKDGGLNSSSAEIDES
jgi:predicted RNase H-like nuclease (RuvC/YqgF family)